MGGLWLEGVVSTLHEGTTNVFFVHTSSGIAIVYPRVYDRHPGVSLGAYVRVRLYPPLNGVASMEVEELTVIDRPVDHKVIAGRNDIEITCDARFVRQIDGWFIFKNEFLGRLAMRNNGGNREQNLKIGRIFRVVCMKTNDDAPSEEEKAFWTVVEVQPVDKFDWANRWFEGVVTRSNDQLIVITSFELSIDSLLRGRDCRSVDRDSFLGQWVRFQVEKPRVGMYLAKSNYTHIDPLIKESRIMRGIFELRVICRFDGEMEEGRPLLQSKIGPIRDNEGILNASNGEGEYYFWVLKHYRPNQSVRWKLSIYDNEPAMKIDNEKCRRREERVKGDRRVLVMMQDFMKIPWLYEKFEEDYPEFSAKIMEVVDRDRQRTYLR